VQFNDLTLFVLYVIPGFIALEVFRYAYPVKTRSDFIIVTWSVVLGLSTSYGLIWLNNTLLDNFFRFKPDELPGITFLLALILGGALIGFLRIALRRLRTFLANAKPGLNRLNPDPRSIWHEVNQAKGEYWAVVFLDDTSIYLGYIQSFRSDPDLQDQDFLLSHASRVDNRLRVTYEIDGLGVYLNTRNVKRIEYYAGTEKKDKKS
jgi:hypothetical protein